MVKEITVVKFYKGRETQFTGTVKDLVENTFGYTLECGNSWNRKINRYPKTAKGLIKALNQTVQETQGSCYDQASYSLAD